VEDWGKPTLEEVIEDFLQAVLTHT
jgi:hypothetical protein